MVEWRDTVDSKSTTISSHCGFESHPGHKKDKINFDNSKKIVIFVVESSLIFVVLYLESF